MADHLHPELSEVLDRELYAVSEAARLLRMPAQTLRNWICGYSRAGRRHPPVLRNEPDDSGITWGEFVEAAYLSFYRQERSISMQSMRRAIEGLRRRYPDVKYPLAHFEPHTSQGQLLAEDVEGDVEDAVSGQLLFVDGVIRRFMTAVDWERDIAVRLRLDPQNALVEVDPLRSFGLPTVSGIRTETLWELFQAGESLIGVGRLYDLDSEAIEAAIRFESSRNEPVLSK